MPSMALDGGTDSVSQEPPSVCPGGCAAGLTCSDGKDGHPWGTCWGCYHSPENDPSCAEFAPPDYPHFYKCAGGSVLPTAPQCLTGRDVKPCCR